MQRLHPRTRVDVLRNEQRASPIRWGRLIYLGILLSLASLGLNWAFGDALLLHADGLVVAERSVAAATYPARVGRVLVREGQRVAAGDVVVELQSADMLRDLAQVSAQNADLAGREAQLRMQAITLTALLPLAEHHARQSADVVAQLGHLSADGLVSSQRVDQALGSEYDTASRLAALHAETVVLRDELPLVMATRLHAADALRQLEALYDGGVIRAARSGMVGALVPAPGQVVRVGEDLLQIYGDRASVLAYLPEMYLFPVSPGDSVEVSSGRAETVGTVDAVLGVADALPPEFQSTFRPRDRSRLIRIRLPEGSPFAVAQKVRIGGCAFGWCWHRSVAPAPAAGSPQQTANRAM